MKNNVIKLIIASIILFGIHYLLLSNFFAQSQLTSQVYQIHLFLGITTTLLVFILERIRAKNKVHFGQGYLVSIVLKMFAAVAFLLPKILGQNEGEKLFVIHFFAAFFIYLFLEVYLLVSNLKKHP